MIYVDDIIVVGDNFTEVNFVIGDINDEFSLNDFGQLSFFLGMKVLQFSIGMLLSQKKYIVDLLTRTNMLGSTPTPILMVVTHKLKANDGQPFSYIQLYRSTVGGLQYVTLTRLDILYVVNKVSQYINHPHDTHWRAVKRILRYLNRTVDHGIVFSSSSPLNLVCYVDADWASSVEDRRSTSCYCIYLRNNTIAWCSKK
ncbi:cysteine-rich RLK (RECEPTOR-like protein kinase) 8 [Hibiscus trionum]|uniref:Cysteine-rich RLK (RECEPTOR-like protein kinase) 8 n=1 Tax=Hibiscus trionum TaxID=183268 RepID=A0A9W7LIF6_HIBTR|nr:cysteine-rich RLK (RECEPTOR-like protein kinase) 8 [Hibiscus trionum]